MFNSNYKGANVTVDQSSYDLVFKDIMVSSNRRNNLLYPNPNNYHINLNINVDKIYKAELIDVYIPAATDPAVNIPATSNRLYFKYNAINGYIAIQAGTYLSPDSIATELTRQFNIVLSSSGIVVSPIIGVSVTYDRNLNRYIIKDRQTIIPGSLTIYPTNGTIFNGVTVINSMAWLLMFDYPTSSSLYISGPKVIKTNVNLILEVSQAVPGDYGIGVPLSSDSLFGNCIISDVVLTECKLYLSLGKLNGETCNVVSDESVHVGNNGNLASKSSISGIFCQVPNNTIVSSAAVKTFLGQPSFFSAVQFYNPCISKLNKLEINWYSDDGQLVRILDHCFTLRVYYFQKRNGTTDFSVGVLNYAATGTLNSIFQR